MRFRNGGTRDLGTGFGRSEIVEQKNEGDRVIGNRCVPTFWNADIDRGAELGVFEGELLACDRLQSRHQLAALFGLVGIAAVELRAGRKADCEPVSCETERPGYLEVGGSWSRRECSQGVKHRRPDLVEPVEVSAVNRSRCLISPGSGSRDPLRGRRRV